MSLLKVNNPRSVLIKAEKGEKDKKNSIVSIVNGSNGLNKIVIDVVKPQPQPKIIKIEVAEDSDLQMPSEFFDCNFFEEKNGVNLNPPGEFYFETDHEALRGNADYQILLRTLAVLQAKKIQVINFCPRARSARRT
jgi:hypothetical protein